MLNSIKEIDRAKVKILREKTGQTLMVCLKALYEHDNDLEKAEKNLQVRHQFMLDNGRYPGCI